MFPLEKLLILTELQGCQYTRWPTQTDTTGSIATGYSGTSVRNIQHSSYTCHICHWCKLCIGNILICQFALILLILFYIGCMYSANRYNGTTKVIIVRLYQCISIGFLYTLVFVWLFVCLAGLIHLRFLEHWQLWWQQYCSDYFY